MTAALPELGENAAEVANIFLSFSHPNHPELRHELNVGSATLAFKDLGSDQLEFNPECTGMLHLK